MSPGFDALPPSAWIALIYGVVNLATLALFAFDKRAAARGAGPAGRIRERTLHLCAVGGGGLGALLGLAWLRHKSRHASFWFSAIAGFALHAIAWSWWITRTGGAAS